MDIRKLQRAIVDGLEDVKAQNIVVFNTLHLSSLFERVIIASGTSNRQTKALASSIREAVKAIGAPVPRMEGEDNGEWIIVDCGAAVVHIMQPAIRDYYRLEEIWGGKAVKMKIGGVKAGLAKAEGADEDAEDEDVPSTRVVKKPRVRKSAVAAPSATAESEAGQAALGGAIVLKPKPVRKVSTGTVAKTPAKKTPAAAIAGEAPPARKRAPRKPAEPKVSATLVVKPDGSTRKKAPAKKTTSGTVTAVKKPAPRKKPAAE